MFESIAQRFATLFAGLGRTRQLTEKNVEDGVEAVKTALLEADVSLDVARAFVDRVQAKAMGTVRLSGVEPTDQFVKVVHDELVALLGGGQDTRIRWNDRGPTVVMMVGLQGTGKTTTCAKLALHLRKKEGKKPLLVAADVKRPAAIEQLRVVGQQVDVPVYSEEGGRPAKICARGVAKAVETGRDVVILDTAGRLHIDADLMDELEDVRDKAQPHEIWLVVDAQVGQDAVTAAREFDRRLAVTGIVLTKADGDARAGAALSLREVTGKPVRFLGTGEKLDAIEPFVPERMATRILGMGDVVGLVEKAQEVVDQEAARKTAERMFRDTWTLEDFRLQLQQIRTMSGKMGGLKGMLQHLPGAAALPADASDRMQEGQLVCWQAAIDSMTPNERMDPETIHGQRRARVARGAGIPLSSVNECLKAFKHMRRQMKELKSSGILGRLAGRQMDKQKRRQLEDLRRKGVDLSQWFPGS